MYVSSGLAVIMFFPSIFKPPFQRVSDECSGRPPKGSIETDSEQCCCEWSFSMEGRRQNIKIENLNQWIDVLKMMVGGKDGRKQSLFKHGAILDIHLIFP